MRVEDGSLVVPVEELMGDLPFAIALEQGEHVRSSGIGPRQLAGPVLNLEVHHGDALDDFNSRETRTDVGRGTVPANPLEYVFGRAAVFYALAVPGNRCGRMKRRAH